MISPRQIRAARALLGWTQGQLAEASGYHLNAISKIEKEIGEPRASTLDRIQAAFEIAGLRFRGQRGVELKEDVFEVRRFEGADFIKHLIDDTIGAMSNPNGEVLTCLVDEQLFNVADRRQNERYYKAMKKTGFRERYLTSKGYQTFVNPDKSVYRWLPEEVLGTVAYAVYADRVCFIKWPAKEVLIIRSQSLAETFRGQFEFLWEQGKKF
jgi:transcriptional regulator with XRE-family HTH domain